MQIWRYITWFWIISWQITLCNVLNTSHLMGIVRIRRFYLKIPSIDECTYMTVAMMLNLDTGKTEVIREYCKLSASNQQQCLDIYYWTYDKRWENERRLVRRKRLFSADYDINHIGGHVKGFITSKKYTRNEIWSLILFQGVPAWYIILSPATNKYPILLQYADTQGEFTPAFIKHVLGVDVQCGNGKPTCHITFPHIHYSPCRSHSCIAKTSGIQSYWAVQ